MHPNAKSIESFDVETPIQCRCYSLFMGAHRANRLNFSTQTSYFMAQLWSIAKLVLALHPSMKLSWCSLLFMHFWVCVLLDIRIQTPFWGHIIISQWSTVCIYSRELSSPPPQKKIGGTAPNRAELLC